MRLKDFFKSIEENPSTEGSIFKYREGLLVAMEGEQMGMDLHQYPHERHKLVVFDIRENVLHDLTEDDIEALKGIVDEQTVFAAHYDQEEALDIQEQHDIERVAELMEKHGLKFFRSVKEAIDAIKEERTENEENDVPGV